MALRDGPVAQLAVRGLGRKGQTLFFKEITLVLIAVQELETPFILEEPLVSFRRERCLFFA